MLLRTASPELQRLNPVTVSLRASAPSSVAGSDESENPRAGCPSAVRRREARGLDRVLRWPDPDVQSAIHVTRFAAKDRELHRRERLWLVRCPLENVLDYAQSSACGMGLLHRLERGRRNAVCRGVIDVLLQVSLETLFFSSCDFFGSEGCLSS